LEVLCLVSSLELSFIEEENDKVFLRRQERKTTFNVVHIVVNSMTPQKMRERKKKRCDRYMEALRVMVVCFDGLQAVVLFVGGFELVDGAASRAVKVLGVVLGSQHRGASADHHERNTSPPEREHQNDSHGD